MSELDSQISDPELLSPQELEELLTDYYNNRRQELESDSDPHNFEAELDMPYDAVADVAIGLSQTSSEGVRSLDVLDAMDATWSKDQRERLGNDGYSEISRMRNHLTDLSSTPTAAREKLEEIRAAREGRAEPEASSLETAGTPEAAVNPLTTDEMHDVLDVFSAQRIEAVADGADPGDPEDPALVRAHVEAARARIDNALDSLGTTEAVALLTSQHWLEVYDKTSPDEAQVMRELVTQMLHASLAPEVARQELRQAEQDASDQEVARLREQIEHLHSVKGR